MASKGRSLVAPLVGAWIEILVTSFMWLILAVAPLVGAWIEIIWGAAEPSTSNVAPLVGAWIEIKSSSTNETQDSSRSSCRSVD